MGKTSGIESVDDELPWQDARKTNASKMLLFFTGMI